MKSKEENRIYNRAYYQKNIDKLRAQRRDWMRTKHGYVKVYKLRDGTLQGVEENAPRCPHCEILLSEAPNHNCNA